MAPVVTATSPPVHAHSCQVTRRTTSIVHSAQRPERTARLPTVPTTSAGARSGNRSHDWGCAVCTTDVVQRHDWGCANRTTTESIRRPTPAAGAPLRQCPARPGVVRSGAAAVGAARRGGHGLTGRGIVEVPCLSSIAPRIGNRGGEPATGADGPMTSSGPPVDCAARTTGCRGGCAPSARMTSGPPDRATAVARDRVPAAPPTVGRRPADTSGLPSCEVLPCLSVVVPWRSLPLTVDRGVPRARRCESCGGHASSDRGAGRRLPGRGRGGGRVARRVVPRATSSTPTTGSPTTTPTTTSAPTAPPGYLRADGTRIEDSSGAVVQLTRLQRHRHGEHQSGRQ